MRRALTLGTALLIAGCLDTSLSDELNWPEGGPPGDAGLEDFPEDDSAPDDWTFASDADPPPDADAPESAPDETAPWFVPAATCAALEVSVGPFCVSSGPQGIALRLWASEPVTARALINDQEASLSGAEAPSSEHHLLIAPLSIATDYAVSVEIVDQGAHALSEGPITVETTALIAPVVLNEVLFDPLGPEPHQEFIELHNHGEAPISLEGWTIADEGGEDPLPPGATLPAGGFAVIVSGRYEPGAGGDPPPAAGALMLALSDAIGSQGLRNGGEELTLRDAEGQVVSLFTPSATPPPSGTSIERREAYGPDGDPANWARNNRDSATPGAANSVTP